jgi:hypothetical protein
MRQETRTRMLRVETFNLAVVSAAGAYLFYYVLTTHGGLFAGIAAAMVAMHSIFEWARLFYKLGRES